MCGDLNFEYEFEFECVVILSWEVGGLRWMVGKLCVAIRSDGLVFMMVILACLIYNRIG